MPSKYKLSNNQWKVFLFVGLVYFVIFPNDVTVFTAPVQQLLAVSHAISPWLYVLASVALVCWTAWKIAGRSKLENRRQE
jgi:hypothetical protein